MCDSVKTYDGSSDSAPLLQTDCGPELPNVIESAGNSLFVSFVSDDSLTSGGFRIRYTTIEDGNTDNPGKHGEWILPYNARYVTCYVANAQANMSRNMFDGHC